MGVGVFISDSAPAKKTRFSADLDRHERECATIVQNSETPASKAGFGKALFSDEWRAREESNLRPSGS